MDSTYARVLRCPTDWDMLDRILAFFNQAENGVVLRNQGKVDRVHYVWGYLGEIELESFETGSP